MRVRFPLPAPVLNPCLESKFVPAIRVVLRNLKGMVVSEYLTGKMRLRINMKIQSVTIDDSEFPDI